MVEPAEVSVALILLTLAPKAMRDRSPDHWSFLLGDRALSSRMNGYQHTDLI
jgi:hypothetical protein